MILSGPPSSIPTPSPLAMPLADTTSPGVLPKAALTPDTPGEAHPPDGSEVGDSKSARTLDGTLACNALSPGTPAAATSESPAAGQEMGAAAEGADMFTVPRQPEPERGSDLSPGPGHVNNPSFNDFPSAACLQRPQEETRLSLESEHQSVLSNSDLPSSRPRQKALQSGSIISTETVHQATHLCSDAPLGPKHQTIEVGGTLPEQREHQASKVSNGVARGPVHQRSLVPANQSQGQRHQKSLKCNPLGQKPVDSSGLEVAEARRRLLEVEGRSLVISQLESHIQQLHQVFIQREMRMVGRGEGIGRLGTGMSQAEIYISVHGQRLKKSLRRHKKPRLLASTLGLTGCVPWVSKLHRRSEARERVPHSPAPRRGPPTTPGAIFRFMRRKRPEDR